MQFAWCVNIQCICSTAIAIRSLIHCNYWFIDEAAEEIKVVLENTPLAVIVYVLEDEVQQIAEKSMQ